MCQRGQSVSVESIVGDAMLLWCVSYVCAVENAACVHVHINAGMHLCMYVGMEVRISVCMYVCMNA